MCHGGSDVFRVDAAVRGDPASDLVGLVAEVTGVAEIDLLEGAGLGHV